MHKKTLKSKFKKFIWITLPFVLIWIVLGIIHILLMKGIVSKNTGIPGLNLDLKAIITIIMIAFLFVYIGVVWKTFFKKKSNKGAIKKLILLKLKVLVPLDECITILKETINH